MAKVRRRAARQHSVVNLVDISENTHKGNSNQRTKIELVPKNLAQEKYVIDLDNYNKRIVLGVGPAGTGKTYLAVLQAIKLLKGGAIDKILLTRPTVTVDDEKFGFLPGDINEKMEPWTKPIFDIFEEYYHPRDIKQMIIDGVIEICPFAFVRGRTFKHTVIIADELQNSTPKQVLALFTRLGENSRIFATGDVRQTDRKQENGLADFIARLGNTDHKHISTCYFSKQDIERDMIVSVILDIYGEED